MRPTNILASTLLFSAACSAWQPAKALLDVYEQEVAPLLKRQSSSSSSGFDITYTGVEGNTATTTTPTATQTSASETGSGVSSTGSDSLSATTGSSGSGSGTTAAPTGSPASSTATQNQTTFDPRLPPGGVQMLEPNAYTTTFYKIGNNEILTWKWNYTSVSVLPSAIDILASCALNDQTYTLALNQSVAGPTGAYTWDTGKYQASATQQLLTSTYTLIIHDANKPASAQASSGYLATFNTFQFAMYSPQAYKNLSEFVCVTCNAGVSNVQRQTFGAVFAMAAVTVLSFSWFAGVAGLW